jgi:hypothetical protein
MALRISSLLFCDDIRNEEGKKLSLMGLYNEKIVFGSAGAAIKWPVPTRLATFIRLDMLATDPKPDTFKFELLLNGKVLVQVEGRITVPKHATMANLSIKGEGVPLQPGSLGIKLTLIADGKMIFDEQVPTALGIEGA